ncbi:MAG: hypothetical protein JWM68_5868 [Verrucomicrobiales bacterium]|nr:hypothetical protein [Verrucomicrobiales bacterium]
MKRYIKLAGEALEGIEFVVYIIAAIILVAVGPLIWFLQLIISHRINWATAVAILWFGSVAVVVREVRRKAITAFSLGIVLTWLIVLVYVFRDWVA